MGAAATTTEDGPESPRGVVPELGPKPFPKIRLRIERSRVARPHGPQEVSCCRRIRLSRLYMLLVLVLVLLLPPPMPLPLMMIMLLLTDAHWRL